MQVSIEDLGTIKITTVSRKSERLSSAAAAIHVITQEEVRRFGVNSLPEALRLTPGLEVARANSRQWAISSRGFNGTFANKLLVLMDGRTVYTPLFSGVFWEETDAVLEDLDRIEVIRGPGATQWGANAVNGVINFMTKSAKDTQGLLISGGGGIEEHAFGTVRYGGKLATNVFYRVYGKYSNHDAFTLTTGEDAADSWWMAQEGFRLDWDSSPRNRLTLQGDYHSGDAGGKVRKVSFSPPRLVGEEFRDKMEGGNILGRWTHDFTVDSELTLQTYYDRADRAVGLAREIRDTLDVDLQHRFQLGERNEIIWGAGYRFSVDDIRGSPDLMMSDPSAGLDYFSAFVQDEITLAPDRLRLTLGTKLERNDFTGFEVQPSARIAWTPVEHHTLWASASRAVRTPSRGERSLMFYADAPRQVSPLPFATLFPVSGNPNFQSEELIAYELGYRVQPHPRFSVDWTGFYNQYDHLRDALRGTPEVRLTSANVPYLLIPLTANNNLSGETYGTEVSSTWRPADFWRLRLGYTFLRLNLDTGNPKPSPGEADAGGSPRHQVFLWSDFDVGRRVEWGLGLRHVGSLAFPGIPAYTELDARLAWEITPNCELSIMGRNLLHAHHREFAPTTITIPNVEVDRAVYVKVTLRL
ncbi:MAG: TonB-dependent receptor [Verrucomicrobia bacterium]|nr:TonB-dependent receptor [Verrucomicrobiota bacterium]